MADNAPILLETAVIRVDGEEFRAISNWPFQDDYIQRLLLNDIPQRVAFGSCTIWAFRNPEEELVGFGTLDFSDDCREFTSDNLHPYIPLLAVNPTIKSKGYGTSIVLQLIKEAATLALQNICDDVLFLDVYTSNNKAIDVYTRCGFQQVSTHPIPDPEENGRPYIVMARRISVAFP